MNHPKAIVFGPTGRVGFSAALTAQSLGAHVVLAMRDTSKPIQGLSSSEESAGNFERISADLSQPDSVSAAVAQTGAKHAFIYLVEPNHDGMRATVQALKAGGIELVVFLSSFSIEDPIREVRQEDAIPWAHAQVEISLEEAFGQGGYIAVRPGAFASNNLQFLPGIHAGEVKVWMPDTAVDCIVPEDIGRVAGTLLVNGIPPDGNTTLNLVGPKLYKQADAIKIIAQSLGKNPKVETATKEEMKDIIVGTTYFPEPTIDYILNQIAKIDPAGRPTVFGIVIKEEWTGNVQRYTGHQPTSFESWISSNKSAWI